jgi:NADP-dependent 3-hydroxy acid dehydrogenase YdfG
MVELKDKVVVVTGASSGIGRATAHAFAERGAKLVLAARSSDQLEEVERECADLGVRAVAVPTDVGANAEVEELAARAERDFGGFDAWVNDAGVMLVGRIDEAPVEDFERVIQTNLLGTAYGSRVALAHFRKKKRGTLINVSSVVGGLGQIYSSAYVASKWGVRGLGESLRMEVAEEPGVHVCTVMPAAIDTPIFQHAANYTGRDIRALAPVYPPEQVAEAIVALMDDPKAEVTVGDAGRIFQVARSLLPQAVTDRLGRVFQEQAMITECPEGAHTGNLHEPSGPTASVRGGWEERVPSGATADAALRALGLGAIGIGVAYLLLHALLPGGRRSAAGYRGG